MGSYLRLEGVRKNFGSFQALRDIQLAIEKGEFICFLGPSGCGKTTLLRIIAGLETQTAGSIHQSERDISVLPPAQRDYGIVFQSYALFPNLTIDANVAYGLVNRRDGRAAIKGRVKELLALVGLPDAGPKYPSQLSGGQQQRIALARALAPAPGLLLLDEPLSALDAIERVRLRGEIRALQQRLGVTTIMVTHDQEEALSMADRIVVMNDARIQQVADPLTIATRPATELVARFMGDNNIIRGRLAERDGDRLVVEDEHGVRASVHAPGDARAPGDAAMVSVRAAAVQIADVDGPAPINSADCEIIFVEFLGDLVKLHLTAGDERLLVKVPGERYPALRGREGERVRISWKEEDVQLLSA